MGVSIFVEIEEAFGKTLPLSVLISSPTIAGLATHIDGATPTTSNWKYLVPIQEKGDLRPLLCMHAAGGNVLFYRDLAKELGEDQPVYGLQARGVADKSETAHDQVEDMAAEYLREIRSLQPTGPYRLCGSSFGGLVAFETAQQLKELGEDVELLALFDTYAPGLINEELESDLRNPLPRLGAQVRNACGQVMAIPSNTERIRFLLGRLRKLSTQLKRKVIWKRNQFAIEYSKATGKELPVDLQRNHKAIDNALKNYRPDLYKGSLILFRAEDQPDSISRDPYLGWGSFTDTPIHTVKVKGAHGALTVYPFASDLADKLRPFLEAVPNKKELGRASSVAAAA